MSDILTPEMPASPSQSEEEGLAFIDLLIIFAKHKRLIFVMPIAVALCAVLITLVMPNVYKANVKILPPQQAQSGAAAVLSQLSGIAGAAAGASGIKNPNDLYIGMLKSRTIADDLIKRFDLQKVYDKELLEKTRKELEDNTTITSGKDGLISIEVEDHDPKRVADIANGYADELLKLTKVLAVTEASQRRLFFERQLEMTKDNLARAESTLKGALGSSGVISVDSDSRAMVETAAKLSAQIAAKEIQLNAMQAFETTENPEYKQTLQQLESSREELSKLENGRPSGESKVSHANNEAGLENVKILREVKYHQMLYELLSKQYEIARLDESKDASIVQVLDKAMEPERKAKPKRLLIALISALIAFIAALFVAVFMDSHGRAMKQADYREKMRFLKNAIVIKPKING